jgi:hypothetical protein
MITSNVIQRVFNIRFAESVATAFTIEYANRQYFVTAKHVAPELTEGDDIELWHNGAWRRMPIRLVGHHNITDVTVFVGNTFIPAHPLPVNTSGLTLGQNVYFLGFPHGLRSEMGELNRQFPVPLVKQGCLSSLPHRMNAEGASFFIDGNNTAGFSGGPVVYKRINETNFNVCGVIHGYMTEAAVVEEIQTSGARQFVRANTGIVKAYSIDSAIELINANPIGIETPLTD